MSWEAWGDGDDGSDGYITDERCTEMADAAFQAGVQVCREMMARFVEQGGDVTTAQSIRLNWNPAWGVDPGKMPDEDYARISAGFDCWQEAP